ncbi:hypothetical protein STEG23_004382, partial [Scotinomys teguina]
NNVVRENIFFALLVPKQCQKWEESVPFSCAWEGVSTLLMSSGRGSHQKLVLKTELEKRLEAGSPGRNVFMTEHFLPSSVMKDSVAEYRTCALSTSMYAYAPHVCPLLLRSEANIGTPGASVMEDGYTPPGLASGFSVISIINSRDMSLYIRMPDKTRENTGSCRTGVTGCEMPDMGIGSPAPVLWKSGLNSITGKPNA